MDLGVEMVYTTQLVDLRSLKKTYGFQRSSWLFCGSALVGRYLYVTGKFGRHNLQGRWHTIIGILDTVDSSWRWVHGTGPAEFLCSFVLYEDSLYCVGSHDWLKNRSKQLSKFDLVLEEWTECAFQGKLPGLLSGCSAFLIERRKQLLLFGGKLNGTKQNDVYLLDMTTESWVDAVVKGRPPSPRWKHGSWMINDVFYCAGGYDPFGVFAREHVYMLHIGARNITTWSTLESNTALWNMASITCFPVNGSVFIFGGRRGETANGATCYNMKSGKFEEVVLHAHRKRDLQSFAQSQAGVLLDSGILLLSKQTEDKYFKVSLM